MAVKPKRKRPSKLETQLRLSIKFAKLEARINALEAEVLRIGRKDLISDSSEVSHFRGPTIYSLYSP